MSGQEREGGMGDADEIALQVGDPQTPTGRCECGREHRRDHNSHTATQQVSCLKCGALWWEKHGEEVEGPAFVPYRRGPQPPSAGLAAERLYKNLRRFNYWQVLALNPTAGTPPGLSVLAAELSGEEIDKAAHKALSSRFRLKHNRGDVQAIFDYVREDAWAFRSDWVVRQMESWRAEGNGEALRKLVTAYSDSRGRTSSQELREVIETDQRLFNDVMDRYQPSEEQPRQTKGTLETVIANVAEDHGVSEDTVKLVYQRYRPFFDQEVPARYNRAEFFASLAAMLARIPASR
jgi:hypothetical protein